MPTRMSLLAALLCAGLATAAQAQSTESAQVAKGRALVQRNCGMCHAVGRSGLSRNPEAPPFRELHRRYDMEMLGEALAEGILTGHPAMPEFRFEPNEVIAIIRYLQSIQAKQQAEAVW
jgi:cytochrome c